VVTVFRGLEKLIFGAENRNASFAILFRTCREKEGRLTVNKHKRRATASKQRKFQTAFRDLKKTTDIGVDGKDTINGPVVMIFGNARGRRLGRGVLARGRVGS